MANSVDPDQIPYSAVSDLGLHRLLRPVCPNSLGKYGNYCQCWILSVDCDSNSIYYCNSVHVISLLNWLTAKHAG